MPTSARVIALIILAFQLFADAASAQTVFILDSSHSMWGQINGVNKTVIMRDVLGRTFTQNEGRLPSAVIAFGAAKSAGCDDIQTLKTMGPVDATYAQAVGGIKPKGSAPIAAAIERAKSLFSPAQPSGSVILIADGLDNCKGDPCAAAAALKAELPGVKISVLAFDARAKDTLAGLSCIAQTTGGLFLPAATAAELEAGLAQAIAASPRPFAVSRAGPQSQISPLNGGDNSLLSPADGASQPRAAPPVEGAPGRVTLAAHLAQGSPPINSGVKWRVFAGEPGEDGTYKLMQTLTDAQPAFVMAPGEYLVSAAYGRANLTKKLAVWPGQSLADAFILNAGGLRLGALLLNGQTIADNQLRFEILSEATDQFGNRERVVENVRTGVILRLNSGYYHIVSVYGDGNARIESDIIIEPGKLTEAIVKHDAAKASFRLVRRAGAEALADTKWTIQTSAGELIKESAGAFPAHILAPGAYRVTANHEGLDYAMDFAINAGEPKQVEIVIPE
ncbi:MAG: VWA domain-containing protein [Hyphomicrobiales bacterium]|nr:VWA domain-containing protein [Hyphomicrobiales bacterium]